MRSRSGLLLARVALIGLLVLCGQVLAEPSTLTVALSSDIRGTEPAMAWHTNTATVLNHVVEGLVGYRGDLSVGTLLAERVDISEDGRRYTFHLRSGVTFHNDAPLSSQDVVWTWRRFLARGSRAYCASWYDGSMKSAAEGVHVVDVRAEGTDVVVFELARANSLFLHLMANPKCYVGVLHRDSVAADGSWRTPIGTGPFRFVRWTRGTAVELARFDGYRSASGARDGFVGDRTPRVASLKFIAMPEPAAAISALASGDVDVVPSIPAHLIHELRARSNIVLHEGEGLGWSALLIQTQAPLLSDRRIRQAIASAIDLEKLSRVAAFGLSKPNASVVPRASQYYDAEQQRYIAFDPDRARKLLAAGGYRGQPIELQTNRAYEDMYNNAIVIQAMLRAVGMDVRLRMLDFPTQSTNFAHGAFQLMSFRYSPRLDPTLGYAAIMGSKAERASVQWEPEPADMRLLEDTTQVAPNARQALFDALHARMLEQVPIVGLQNEYLLDATTRRVRGYELLSMDFPRLWGVEKR